MEDRNIIELYLARDEKAIGETDIKYGALCRSLAMNILGVFQDAEECVSDSYHRVWSVIPPQVPVNFKAFVARIVRNLSISRWRKQNAEKRGGGRCEELLSELGDCVPGTQGDPVSEMEKRELARCIDDWLSTLDEGDRYIFVRRYWYGEAVKDISKATGTKSCAQRLFRLRQALCLYLQKEGFAS